LGKRGKSVAKSNHLGALATAVAVLAAVGVLGLVGVRPAEATFPGKNGKIAFRSNRDDNSDIYTMNADRTKRARVVRLTTDPALDEDPAFSPDGKKIAFESDRDGDSDIYKITVKGRKLVRLTTDPATTFGADWGVR